MSSRISHRFKGMAGGKTLTLTILFIVSLAVRLAFIFWGTDYEIHLFSDMEGYWQRALERFNGNSFDPKQWAICTPLPHILLSWVFEVLELAGLGSLRLEAVLFLNALVSSASVCFLYLAARKIFPRPGVADLVSWLYALSYPLIYLNAFVLSENIAGPLLIFSLWLILREDRAGWIFGGIALGLAVGIRPVLGLLAGLFAIYAVARGTSRKGRVINAVAFVGPLIIVLGLVSLENARISRGHLKGISAYGGLVFYLNQSKLHSLIVQFDGYEYTIIPPPASHDPDRGSRVKTIPVYDQAAWYREGWSLLRQDPGLWWKNLVDLKNLFSGPLLPTVTGSFGFAAGTALFRKIHLITALSLILWFLAARTRVIRDPRLWLILGIPLVMAITHFIYGAEQRYLYSFVFTLYLAFFGLLEEFSGQWARREKPVLVWLAVALVVVFW